MKRKLYEDKLEIPKNVQVDLVNNTIKVKGPKGELQKELKLPHTEVKKENNYIAFKSKSLSRKEKRIINTYKSHIKNMFEGVNKEFTYKLKICSGHFPMTVEIKGNEFIVKNFFGEKIPRKAKILPNVKVAINKDEVNVSGINKELASQTAANIERATTITNRDKRVFMDGIWIIEKEGVPIR